MSESSIYFAGAYICKIYSYLCMFPECHSAEHTDERIYVYKQ